MFSTGRISLNFCLCPDITRYPDLGVNLQKFLQMKMRLKNLFFTNIGKMEPQIHFEVRENTYIHGNTQVHKQEIFNVTEKTYCFFNLKAIFSHTNSPEND